MKSSKLMLGALLFAGMTSADAAPPSISEGAKKSEVCQGCHGAKGISGDSSIPKLAGQYPEYIVKQITDFQMQSRRDDRMSPMAGMITNLNDAKDIAAYFASQTPMKGKPAKSAQVQLGKKIYESGIPDRGIKSCAGCHGPAGKGTSKDNPLFPVIGGQHKTYLLKQLDDFRTNKRTSDPTGIMTFVGRNLEDLELEAVADYIAGM